MNIDKPLNIEWYQMLPIQFKRWTYEQMSFIKQQQCHLPTLRYAHKRLVRKLNVKL